MVVYNLDETPNIFISAQFYDNKFIYRMTQVVGDNREVVRTIDLRNDKLRIYCNEINESMFQRLYDSLTFRNKAGRSYSSLIHNVIFDWSPFGVTVPNSVNDLLRKALEHNNVKMNALNQELASSNAALKGLQDELLSFKNETRKMEFELQKVNDELSCVSSELHSTKDKLECSNNNVTELKARLLDVEDIKDKLKDSNNELNERILACERIKMDMEVKLQKACEKITSSDFEIRHYKVELKSCKDKNELQKKQDQISTVNYSLKTKNQELEMKLKSLEDEHCLVQSELHSTKDQREVLSKNVKELEERLLSSESQSREMEEELEKVQDQLRKAIEEVQCNVNLLEILRKEVEELNDQIKLHEKEKCFMHKMWSNCFSSIKEFGTPFKPLKFIPYEIQST
ncbi:hypothetical protein RND81_09G097400 [Saponaria officinalis]|uniref:Uncharacterized protein n=1 Tax=Saponaria officinalis TaxID=3572 RepID=A0AAW1IKT4_SAPOF